jgi:O-antigen/teichoic acid export membrane protein
MSGIKKLAGQTLWYGIPTITSRFLGYLMNLTLPLFFDIPAKTADLTQTYAIIPFLNILFTYGIETGYFRFSSQKDRDKLYNTLSISLLGSTLLFTALLLLFSNQIAGAADLADHPEYIWWMAGIIFFDTLATLPFAKLRQENRPKRYALVRLAGIVINIIVVILFVGIIPAYVKNHPTSYWARFVNPQNQIIYYLIGNFFGSLFTFLLLYKEFTRIRFQFDGSLWKEVMRYCYPLIIVGMGGMVNDVLSRLIYRHAVNLPAEQADHELGIFANIYRIAVLITIVIQAFRMAAEPFFFSQSGNENAPRTYARVMKFFVIVCCFLLLGIGLFLDVIEWAFLHISKNWAEGLGAVPLLALGNVFLGIYYNLSVWYKLTNKNRYGAMITLVGAIITIGLNLLLIPRWHYTGAAIATFCCYLFMMVACYRLGQKHYPIPYARKKLTAYLVLVMLLYFLHLGITHFIYGKLWFSVLTGMLLFGFFTWFVGQIEAKELAKLPVIGKYFNKK